MIQHAPPRERRWRGHYAPPAQYRSPDEQLMVRAFIAAHLDLSFRQLQRALEAQSGRRYSLSTLHADRQWLMSYWWWLKLRPWLVPTLEAWAREQARQRGGR